VRFNCLHHRLPFAILCHQWWTFRKPYLHRDGGRGQDDILLAGVVRVTYWWVWLESHVCFEWQNSHLVAVSNCIPNPNRNPNPNSNLNPNPNPNPIKECLNDLAWSRGNYGNVSLVHENYLVSCNVRKICVRLFCDLHVKLRQCEVLQNLQW